MAYETARQLMEKGHEVALLAMFDTANPAFQQRVLKESWLGSRAKKIKFLADRAFGVTAEKCAGYVAEKGEGAPSENPDSRLANPV